MNFGKIFIGPASARQLSVNLRDLRETNLEVRAHRSQEKNK